MGNRCPSHPQQATTKNWRNRMSMYISTNVPFRHILRARRVMMALVTVDSRTVMICGWLIFDQSTETCSWHDVISCTKTKIVNTTMAIHMFPAHFNIWWCKVWFYFKEIYNFLPLFHIILLHRFSRTKSTVNYAIKS